MPQIFCFGSDNYDGDNISHLLSQKIKKYKNFEFVIAKSPQKILDIPNELNDKIIILDVVKNLPNTQIISVDKLVSSKSLTAHDADLCFYLQMLTITKKIKNPIIIGLPLGEKNLEKLEKEVLDILNLIT